MIARPDLCGLSDDDLVEIANRGLWKRASAEVASVACRVSVDDETIQLEWDDAITCRFPPGSSIVGGKCSCGALTVCRHLLRSCLYVRDHWRPVAGESARAAPPESRSELESVVAQPTVTVERTSTAEPAVVDDLLEMPTDRLRKMLGTPAWKSAQKKLASGLEGLADRPNRTVSFPALGVAIRVLPGATTASIVCNCGGGILCSHALPALLLLRGEQFAHPVPALSAPQRAGRRRAAGRLVRLLKEFVRAGVGGLSSGWFESAQTAAIDIRKAGLTRPSELVDALVQQAERSMRGVPSPDRRSLRWLLAALWVRSHVALGDRETNAQGDDDLISRPTLQFWDGRACRLLGLGCSAWWGEEIFGIKVHLLDEYRGEFLAVGTGRPRDYELSPAHLAASVPILGELTAVEILGQTVDCSATRRSADGKIRLAEGAHASAAGPIDWIALARKLALRRFRDLADRLGEGFPTFITLHQTGVFLVAPTSWQPATWSADEQRFHWPMIDADGQVLPAVLSFRPERRDAILACQRFAENHQPFLVLGSISLEGGKATMTPTTLVARSPSAEMVVHHVDLGTEAR